MNKKVNFNIFKKFWDIAKLYWLGEEKKGAFTLLILLGLLLIGYTQLSVLLNRNQGELISTLAAKDEALFWGAVQSFLTVLVIYVPLFAGFSYVQSKLGLYWRKWLSEHFLGRYFANRSFYQLSAKYKEIDNPDQRISEDIRGFTQDSLLFLLVIVQSVLQVIAFSAVLWSISQRLVIFLLVYAIAGTIITTGVFGKKLVNLNFAQLQKEANFRFGLVRVRENSESIAFYQGERQEENHLNNLFNDVYKNFNSLIIWQELYLGLFVNTFEFLPYVIPAVIVAPSVLSGDLEVGKVSEATGAFARVFFSLNIIVSRFQSLTSFAAGVNRLSSFYEFLKIEDKKSISTQNKPTIDTVISNKIATNKLTLQTPNYQNTLFDDLSLELPPQQGLLIMGSSGCGKSSLLRAIGGLWNSGTGVIYRPKLEEMLFLPQRPYMIIGTLREQLTYPSVNKSIDDQELQEVLNLVNLSNLAERFGGFEVEKDWGEVLSLGEQQRVAFARIFINKPKYVILDEATSALDVNNEASLYSYLKLQNITYISVGHRESLKNYHQSTINFDDNKSILITS
ncbi:ABC transporter ATP-binding protein/permease [Cyanobacterium stanieri LEGE 03274]|uniref:ABC transporter ATP-binding protein/permease n=1 Tax=Cyanobacterium stanieri LEGE 03274 TaxID=1828756 RepID=A0ABR9V6I6_9CHRO|nr:ABC transporter ATP-binding protein/permease [Cyanobacterium stanieri]MBE9223508.1 ABC transporter ATP-binding protein/permease [Cyanobacterium stanieri LEGE 03274]